ncbi:MAG TPA: ATPase domain-containing protein [Candidatus Bilamarchaeum sp.]|nr:ATPase domain-containing protein [Candidatus Bilamarchaeum sp.]
MVLAVNEQMPILKGNRLSTGILDLDVILEGGYYNPGNIIILGPSGMEKAAMGYHFASAAGPNETAFIVCGNSSPPDIMNKAATMGINLNKPNISFIDCYSSTLGSGEVKPQERVKVVPGPGALNDISLALNESIKESNGKKMRVVFDTLSTFVLYNPQDSIRKFLSVIEGRLKSVGATTLYLVDEGVHDKQLVSLLEHGMDEVYTILDKGGKYAVLVPEINMEVPIRVGPAGIIIV